MTAMLRHFALLMFALQIAGCAVLKGNSVGEPSASAPGYQASQAESSLASTVAEALALYNKQQNDDAINALTALANRGDIAATAALGKILLEQEAEQGSHDAGWHFTEMAAHAGHAESQFVWARRIEVEKHDYHRAAYWYEHAAGQGLLGAMLALSNLLLDDQHTFLYNPASAIKWLTLAARAGSAEAEFRLGEEFWTGAHVTRSDAQAVAHFSRALSTDFTAALYYLARAYREGRGVEQNIEQALFFYRKAAEHSDARAMQDLAQMYWFGDGVQQDCNMTLNLYERLASFNIEYNKELAWFLATADCVGVSVRNGDRAVALIIALIEHKEQTGVQPALFDTLAAAYAEAGDFNKAVVFQKQVIELLKQRDADTPLTTLQYRLLRYEQQLPERVGAAI